MKTHWTASLTLCIVKALFALTALTAHAEPPVQNAKLEPRATQEALRSAEEELKCLREEQTVLRKEFAELLAKHGALEAEYRRLQLSVAASYARGEKTDLTDRDTDVLASFKMVADAGRELAGEAVDFSTALKETLAGAQLDKVEQAKLLIRMDSLREKSAKLLALTQSRLGGQRPDRCRVYEVNQELQTVALSAGSVNGVRNGLIFWGGDKRDIQLRVVAVRPFVSAAVLTEGRLRDLAPGMTVYASREKGVEPEKASE